MSEASTAPAQTEFQLLRRVQGLVDYLYGINDQELVTPRLARLAWQDWTSLSNGMSNALLVPDACPGPNGELFYTWDRDGHHLELEIFPDAPAEFFYENDGSGEVWEATFAIGEPVPPEALDKLQFVVQA
jgi:hypothetical protein